MVVIHHEIVRELASLRFLKLNLECENIKMGRITYEDLFFSFMRLFWITIMQSGIIIIIIIIITDLFIVDNLR